MKKYAVSLLIIVCCIPCRAQPHLRYTEASVFLGTIQYRGEAGDQFFNSDEFEPASGISVSEYVSPSFDLGLQYMQGSIRLEREPRILSADVENLHVLLKFKLNNGRILKSNSRVGPYLFTGVGGSNWKNTRTGTRGGMGYVPVGAGLSLRLSRSLLFFVQCTYLHPMTDSFDGDATSSDNDGFICPVAGFSLRFNHAADSDDDGVKDRKDRCPETPKGVVVDASGCPLDRDSDLVADYLDTCPDVAGVQSAGGCPDADGDSITDSNDKCPGIAGPRLTFGCPDRDLDEVLDADDRCPDVKGLVEMKGCPDTDEDSIPDPDDSCATEKGPLRTNGCPDRDRDGIADREDACPDTAGIAMNRGCPEVKEEIKEIIRRAISELQFETGKDIIKKVSYPIMDEVVRIMLEHPEYKLVINGHTDSIGTPEKNEFLSQRRAAAARKYLTDHGVEDSRIESHGFGSRMPVADNRTKAGRALNRRVEFVVVF